MDDTADGRARQSFAKNAGLYGERVGALHVVAPTEEVAVRVKSQLSVLQRSEISNPPAYGARVVRGAPRRVCVCAPRADVGARRCR